MKITETRITGEVITYSGGKLHLPCDVKGSLRLNAADVSSSKIHVDRALIAGPIHIFNCILEMPLLKFRSRKHCFIKNLHWWEDIP